MTDVDALPGRLRQQMRAATAADLAPPDLHDRVHRSAARRRHRNQTGLAVVALGAGLAAVAFPTRAQPPEPDSLAGPAQNPAQLSAAPIEALSVVRSDSGRLDVSVSSADGTQPTEQRTEHVELPGYLRNNAAAPITVLGMTVPGTQLRSDFPDQMTIVPGGRLPLALTRLVDCNAGPSIPARLDLRVTAIGPTGQTSVLLPLPEEVVALYRTSHACSPERRAADDAEARAAEQARRQAEQAQQQTETADPADDQ